MSGAIGVAFGVAIASSASAGITPTAPTTPACQGGSW